jgi:hypothetical protein
MQFREYPEARRFRMRKNRVDYEKFEHSSLNKAQTLWGQGFYMALRDTFTFDFMEMNDSSHLRGFVEDMLKRSGNRFVIYHFKKLFPGYKGNFLLFTKRYWGWPVESPHSIWSRQYPGQWDRYFSFENNARFARALRAAEYQPETSEKIQRCFRKLVEAGKIKPVK